SPLLGSHGLDLAAAHATALVGREQELATLRAALDAVAGGAGRLVEVVGDIGTGKSRLLAEGVARARRDGLTVHVGDASSYGAVAAYEPWWDIWRALVGVEDGMVAADVATHLADVLPEDLRPRLPLVGSLVGIPLADNELTASFDAKLRKTSLEQLAVRLLESTASEPVLLVLDDAHQFDPLSRDLLTAICRTLADLPVGVLLGHRPTPEPAPGSGLGSGLGLGLGLDRFVEVTEIQLERLAVEQTVQLARAELQATFGEDHEVDDRLVQLVVDRSDGNPLWVRELCRYLHERASEPGADGLGPRPADTLDLPATLHGLMLSRLDRLAETPRRTAKVASVVGRAFDEVVLVHGYPELGAEGDIHRALKELERSEVAEPEDLAGAAWIFTQALLRDVAYESLPFRLRRMLHERVARALESGVLGDPARWLDQLAHHFWHGDDEAKKRHYLRLAGEAAQARYDHAAALLCYRRLVDLLPGPEQAEIQVRIGKTLELQGDWAGAEASYDQALVLATQHQDRSGATWARTWLAEVARKRGRYDEAAIGLDRAATDFAELGDDAGAGQVWHLSGTLSAQQGDFETAQASYARSLEIRERLGDRTGMAALLSNLAVVAEYQGDYDEAGRLGEQALALRREIGDRWAIGISQNNLGMLAILRGRPEEARERFEESMALHTEVGDTWMVALGHHNLSNVHRDLGETDRAREYAVQALAAYRAYDDAWALASLLEDVALLDAGLGRAEDAWRLVGASDAVCERLGSPRTPDVWSRLHDVLDPLSDAVSTEQLRSEGAALGDAEVDEMVRAAGL
ncbi:tetratricopeptide repeat protein, partial [Nocardioides sp.]|uniref:ATP-binding protein n=1 Tax=Nocardioides sp. TaxID=35761 RepID=UPI00356A7ACB